MDVKCGDTLFGEQDIAVMIKFIDDGDALVTIGMVKWLLPARSLVENEIRDAIQTALKRTEEQLENLNNPKEAQQ